MSHPNDPHRRRFLRTATLATLSLLQRKALATEESNATGCLKVVDDYVHVHGFKGVVALGRRGSLRFSKTVGLANVQTHEAMAIDSVFGIASISKMLTTVSVLLLQEEDSLRLDQPIHAYLPYLRKDLSDKLTLRHLLANNSGVPNLFSSAVKTDPKIVDQALTTEQAVHRFCEGDLLFTPGERFDYSLSNWILVLAIVEAATKMDYSTAMRKLTLDPLRLRNTTADQDVAAVQSYDNATPPGPRTQQRPTYIAAAGGYFSNANDLMRAAHLIFDTHFLSASSRRELTTIEVASDQYALGGRVREVQIGSRKIPAAWDTGNALGYRSVLGHRLDGKATVVVLNNTSMSQKTLDEFSDALLVAFN